MMIKCKMLHDSKNIVVAAFFLKAGMLPVTNLKKAWPLVS